jgi:mandelamide amidase
MNGSNEETHNRRQAVNSGELTATEAVGHIRDGDLTAESNATALLRICKANRDLNALTWISEQKLLESARRSDLARMRGEAPGPLTGIPVVVKDNIDTIGFPAGPKAWPP